MWRRVAKKRASNAIVAVMVSIGGALCGCTPDEGQLGDDPEQRLVSYQILTASGVVNGATSGIYVVPDNDSLQEFTADAPMFWPYSSEPVNFVEDRVFALVGCEVSPKGWGFAVSSVRVDENSIEVAVAQYDPPRRLAVQGDRQVIILAVSGPWTARAMSQYDTRIFSLNTNELLECEVP